MTCRSLFGDVPIRIRRLLTCPCQNRDEARSFTAFDLEAASVAPELAYVTARYAALAPFGKVAALLSELLPISGVQNAGTMRNRTLRVGEDVVQLINETYAAQTVREPWQAGDLMLVDNVRTAHSREPFEGPRDVVAAMAGPVRLADCSPAVEVAAR